MPTVSRRGNYTITTDHTGDAIALSFTAAGSIQSGRGYIFESYSGNSNTLASTSSRPGGIYVVPEGKTLYLIELHHEGSHTYTPIWLCYTDNFFSSGVGNLTTFSNRVDICHVQGYQYQKTITPLHNFTIPSGNSIGVYCLSGAAVSVNFWLLGYEA